MITTPDQIPDRDRQFWNEAVETRSEEEVREVQVDKIRRQIARCYELSPFYRAKMEAAGAAPEDIKTWEDFRRLPIMLTPAEDKEQHQRSLEEDGHPYGKNLCVSPSEVLGMASTSGTTGQPTVYGFTRYDMGVMNEIMARAFWRIGIRPGDTVLHAFGLSMWVLGVPVVRALEAMGVRAVPVGAEGGSERLLMFARLTRPSTLLCTPSYAESLIERARVGVGVEVGELGIRRILCAGEPGAGLPNVRHKIEAAWGAKVFDFAGGPWGIGAVSCGHEPYQGMHLISEDCSLNYDLVDPETKEPKEITDGAIGAVVITSYDWEAGPPIKFLNNDLTQIDLAPCPCGLPGKRRRILGRIDDMLIIRGINVYPAAVKNLINGFVPRVTGELRIVLNDPPPRIPSPVHIKVEGGAGLSDGELERLKREIHGRIRDLLRFTPELELVAPGSLARTHHKGKLIEKTYEQG
jgi:phenylacetate-CoA ligase